MGWRRRALGVVGVLWFSQGCYGLAEFPRENPYDVDSTLDFDADGVPNNQDAFPTDAAEWDDTDGDLTGDHGDNCPDEANPDQTDRDQDGVGDACDSCIDVDGDLYGSGPECVGTDCDDTTASVTAVACGDGRACGAEECDDHNLVDGDGCDANCTRTRCGNGVRTGSEACDDGNTDDCTGTCAGDCSRIVAITGCGDGVVCDSEACDDSGESAACNADCTTARCGDGIRNLTRNEACDDGNTDGCTGTCAGDCSRLVTITGCGDGVACGGEACDDGGESATCNVDCTTARCGDGITNATRGEACDDGAESATCNANCTTARCGDGITNATRGEPCDDGFNDICGTCNATCSGPGVGSTCGDGIPCPETEACDDGANGDPCDGCLDSCATVSNGCGDGFVCGNELCDDGNNDDCRGSCRGDCSGVRLLETCLDGTPLYVDFVAGSDSGTTNDGKGWDRAFKTLQKAIDVANASGQQTPICVKTGSPSGLTTIELKDKAHLLGGFAGTEACGLARDFAANPTNINIGATAHILSASNVTDATIDGFILGSGKASFSGGGGALTLTNSSVVVSNDVFRWNTTVFNGAGAGAIAVQGGHPVIAGSSFFGNDATSTQSAGAILVQGGAAPVIRGCVFANNGSSNAAGGAIQNASSYPVIDDAIFAGNRAWVGGALQTMGGFMRVEGCTFVAQDTVYEGAIYVGNGHARVENCLFAGNKGGGTGGAAVYAGGSPGLEIRNTTMVGNQGFSTLGGANSEVSVVNSILSSTGTAITDGGTSTISISYSDVSGGSAPAGAGNLNADPLFAGSSTGTWTANETVNAASWEKVTTTLTDANAAWATNSLVGLLLNPKVSQGLLAVIVGNTATTMTVVGDLTAPPVIGAAQSFAGQGYQILDYRPASSSPCVDAADGDKAPPTDKEGKARYDAAVTDSGRGSPAFVDMGCYEYAP